MHLAAAEGGVLRRLQRVHRAAELGLNSARAHVGRGGQQRRGGSTAALCPEPRGLRATTSGFRRVGHKEQIERGAAGAKQAGLTLVGFSLVMWCSQPCHSGGIVLGSCVRQWLALAYTTKRLRPAGAGGGARYGSRGHSGTEQKASAGKGELWPHERRSDEFGAGNMLPAHCAEGLG